MAWSDTLDALVALLAGVDGVDAVLRVPAVTAAEIGVSSTVVVLTPAGRKTSRLAGGDRERVWTQRVTVLRKVAATNSAAVLAAIDAVTAATLAVDDALDARITLAGEATVVTPFAWDEGAAFEIPPDSGQIYAGQSGTCDVHVVGAGPRGA
ncbi:MAG: hypothetical protein F4Y14_18390 [Acidobacteria bacterium]|nr:hypothetical protein [Acidobacteriota bacterium]